MKKIIFTVALLVATVGVFGTSEAAWFFNKKAEKRAETNTSANSAVSILGVKGADEKAKLVINKEGTGFSLLAGGAIVKIKTADTLTTEISFGTVKVGLTVKANTETKVFRSFGGKSEAFVFSDIAVNDTISVEGELDTTGTSLTVIAKKIQDLSVQARDASYSGTIKAINTTDKTFVLDIPNNTNDLTIVVSASTTLKKITTNTQENNSATIAFTDLKVNDIVKNATGIANTQTMRLSAKEVIITERAVSQHKIKDVFATVVSVDQGNSMSVRTTAGVTYTVSFKNSNTVYNKWTISKKYRGVKKNTDGTTEVSTLSDLALKAEDNVWISGTVQTGGAMVIPTLIEKEFYR